MFALLFPKDLELLSEPLMVLLNAMEKNLPKFKLELISTPDIVANLVLLLGVISNAEIVLQLKILE